MALLRVEKRYVVTFTPEEMREVLNTFEGDTMDDLHTIYLFIEPERVEYTDVGVHDNCRDDMTFRYKGE